MSTREPPFSHTHARARIQIDPRLMTMRLLAPRDRFFFLGSARYSDTIGVASGDSISRDRLFLETNEMIIASIPETRGTWKNCRTTYGKQLTFIYAFCRLVTRL